MTLPDLIPILQVAVGPVILVSGVGLLLLSMTNRYGRIIDGARQMAYDRRTVTPDHRQSLMAQLRTLLRRAHIVRGAIAWAALSVLLAALLVILLFISALLNLGLALPITCIFVLCMGCLIFSLALFIMDINLSLTALELEVGSLDDDGV